MRAALWVAVAVLAAAGPPAQADQPWHEEVVGQLPGAAFSTLAV